MRRQKTAEPDAMGMMVEERNTSMDTVVEPKICQSSEYNGEMCKVVQHGNYALGISIYQQEQCKIRRCNV
jgi:hypothetical protein